MKVGRIIRINVHVLLHIYLSVFVSNMCSLLVFYLLMYQTPVYVVSVSERDCVKFYHPTSGPTMLASVCEGQTCVCAEGQYKPYYYSNNRISDKTRQ